MLYRQTLNHSILFALLAAPLSAQMHWARVNSTQSPAPRYGHAASSDYLMFGGRDDVQAFDDTWAYGIQGVNGVTSTWIPVPTPIHPSARYDHEVAAVVGGMLMFGGFDSNGDRLGDTWLLSGGWVSGPPHVWLGDWTQQQSTTSPTARTGHAMAYDLMHNVECIMFGGRTDSGLNNETWRFSGGQWTKLSPTVSPSAREGHVLVADIDGWLMIGGEDQNGVSTEAWRFDGTDWQQITDVPFAASGASAVFLSFERQRLLVVGGHGANGQVGSDAFELTRDGLWLNQGSNGQFTPRTDTVLMQHLHVVFGIYPHRTTALMFGGRDQNGNVLGDTVRLQPTNVVSSEQISTGCGPGAWGNTGPDLFMQSLVLGNTRDLSVFTQSPDIPVFVGAEFDEVAAPLPCQIGINPAVILFGVTTGQHVSFPIHAPFDPALRGAGLSFQALAFESAGVHGLSLSGVTVVRLGD